MKDQLIQLELSKLNRDPNQPRKEFCSQALKELTVSVKAQGIIQPIVARPDPKNEGQFLVVAGERRYRAARRAKLTQVPVLVKYDLKESLRAVQLTENFHREDLTLLEIAEGVENHIATVLEDTDKKRVTNQELAKEFGRNPTYWSRVRKVSKAPETLKEAIRTKTITNINVVSDLINLHGVNADSFSDVWSDYVEGNITGNLEEYVSCQLKLAKQIKKLGDEPQEPMAQSPSMAAASAEPVTITVDKKVGSNEVVKDQPSQETEQESTTNRRTEQPAPSKEDIAVLQEEMEQAINDTATSGDSTMMNLSVPAEIQPLLSRVVGYYIAVSESMGQSIGKAQVEKMVTQLTGQVRSVH